MLSDDGWVQNTLRAVEFAVKNGFEILTSIGLRNHELVLWAAAEFSGRVRVVVPQSISCQDVAIDFEMPPELIRCIPVSGKGRSWWRLRDRFIVENADVIIPVSIRPGGNLESLLDGMPSDKIVRRFRTPYQSDCSGRLPSPPVKDEIKLPEFPWNHLTHWTHTTFEPGMGETKRQFYRKIVSAKGYYPYSAFENLKNILKTRKIFATPTVRNGVRVVSFTALNPVDSQRNMRWAAFRGRYYWEPYGIAIAFDVAVEMGIRPVIYGDEATFLKLKENERPYFQPVGRRGQWRSEMEYRHVGDFDLRHVPRDALIAVVRTEEEAIETEALFDIRAISLQKA